MPPEEQKNKNIPAPRGDTPSLGAGHQGVFVRKDVGGADTEHSSSAAPPPHPPVGGAGYSQSISNNTIKSDANIPIEKVVAEGENKISTPPKKVSWIKPLRTYKSDIALALKRQKQSLARMVIAEKEKRGEEERVEEREKRLLEQKKKTEEERQQKEIREREMREKEALTKLPQEGLYPQEKEGGIREGALLGRREVTGEEEVMPKEVSGAPVEKEREIPTQVPTPETIPKEFPPKIAPRVPVQKPIPEIETEKELEQPQPLKQKIAFAILSFLLIVAGLALIFVAFLFFSNLSKETDTRIFLSQNLIITEEQEVIRLSQLNKKELGISVTETIQKTKLPLNSIKGLYIVKKIELPGADKESDAQEQIIELSELFFILEASTPGGLVRAFRDNFLFGIHSFVENRPFLIIKTDPFANAFSGMLQWESFMVGDLEPLFIFGDIDKNSLASEFEDVVIKNQDTRTLKDVNGNSVLLYSFIDKETLIITTNETTFDELVVRLKTPREIIR